MKRNSARIMFGGSKQNQKTASCKRAKVGKTKTNLKLEDSNQASVGKRKKSETASTNDSFPPKIKLEFVDTDAINDDHALIIKEPHEEEFVAVKVEVREWPTVVDTSIVKEDEVASDDFDFQFDLNDKEYFDIIKKLKGDDSDHIEIEGASQMCPDEGCKKMFETKGKFCDECGVIFKGDMSAHLKEHESKPFQKVKQKSGKGVKLKKCDICLKEFKTTANFKQHIKMVHMSKGFDCQWCFKNLRCKKSLEGHMALHTDVKDFICELCGREFSTEKLLIKHGPAHETNNSYQCEICFMSFECAKKISRHKRLHGPPILCILCPQSFSYDSHMRRHLKLSHSDVDGIKIPRPIPSRWMFGKEGVKNGIEASEGSSGDDSPV